MRRAIAIQQDLLQISTVEDLTGVFESVASVKIAKIRNRVVESKEFFSELWQTYRGLRVNPKEHLASVRKKSAEGQVFVAVTTEGKLSGDIANRVIDEVAEAYQGNSAADIIVLGAHGASQLQQRGITVTQMFHLSETDTEFNSSEIIASLEKYSHIQVFYQTYESLRVQRAAQIELISAVSELSDEVEEADSQKLEIMTSHDYIFEPGISEIASYLESLMMGVALTQVLMESRLAQYASRFNAMNAAKHRAREMGSEYSLLFHRAKRAEGDDRIRETMTIAKGQQQ